MIHIILISNFIFSVSTFCFLRYMCKSNIYSNSYLIQLLIALIDYDFNYLNNVDPYYNYNFFTPRQKKSNISVAFPFGQRSIRPYIKININLIITKKTHNISLCLKNMGNASKTNGQAHGFVP